MDNKTYDTETKLRLYRIQKASEYHLDQKNIFDDIQLERMLTFMPQTLDDLENILPTIQIKLLGKDILKILNEENKN